MATDPEQGPNAPKRDITLARDALLKFGDPASLDISRVDAVLTVTAKLYSSAGNHAAQTEAIGDVAQAATAYARALERLAALSPGFPGPAAVGRGRGGSRDSIRFMGVPVQAEGVMTPDDLDIAIPEISLPLERRPKVLLAPSIERAHAMSRFARAVHSQHAKIEARGKRNEKQMLAEACFLIVAACFGPEGTAKIRTTPSVSRGEHSRRAPRTFPEFLVAMHRLAHGAGIVESTAFDRQIKDAIKLMKSETEGTPAWYGWLKSTSDAESAEAAAMRGSLFLIRFAVAGAKPSQAQ